MHVARETRPGQARQDCNRALPGAQGVMRTHDEETKDYFAHTDVRVRLAYRGSTQEKNCLRCSLKCCIPADYQDLICCMLSSSHGMQVKCGDDCIFSPSKVGRT